jgi:glycosyltransferase involved in cell wall biosynthesis
MLPIAETLSASGELKQIICQINAGSPFPGTVAALPDIVRYPLRALEKFAGLSLSRQTQDRVFYFFAAWRLKPADVTFIHGGFFMPRTVARARALGSIVVDISVNAELASNANLEQEELTLLGYPEFAGTYALQLKETAPLLDLDYLLLMSEYTKRTYLEAGYSTERIFIAHIDVDTERFKPHARKKGEPFRVLYLAFTQPLKGVHYLLDAWESLDLPNSELRIVGDYSAMPEELKKAYQERIERNPTIVKRPGTQMPEAEFADASVYVFPTLTEGFGRSALEALSSGLPVITTEHAPNIIKDDVTGYIVPIRSGEAIAQKLQHLYDHPDEAKRMGEAARQSVLHKKPFGKTVEEIYFEIMRREKKI